MTDRATVDLRVFDLTVVAQLKLTCMKQRSLWCLTLYLAKFGQEGALLEILSPLRKCWCYPQLLCPVRQCPGVLTNAQQETSKSLRLGGKVDLSFSTETKVKRFTVISILFFFCANQDVVGLIEANLAVESYTGQDCLRRLCVYCNQTLWQAYI